MTTPEVQKQAISKEDQSARFKMIINPQESGLTLAEQASLIEHYEEPEWRDEAAIQFYDSIFNEIKTRPNEFVATATTYEHGMGIDVLLPDPGKLIRPNTVGGVVLHDRKPADMSGRIPRWTHFPWGVELFISNNADSYHPFVPTFATPIINLTDARLIKGRGQNPPQAIEVLVGNQAIADWVGAQLQAERITPQSGLDTVLAIAVIAEGHGVNPVVVPELNQLAIQSETHYYLQHARRLQHAQRIARFTGQIATLHRDLVSAGEMTAQQLEDIPKEGSSQSLMVRDQRGWPLDADSAFAREAALLESAKDSLQRMRRELDHNQVPLAKFYLDALRRYIKASLEQS